MGTFSKQQWMQRVGFQGIPNQLASAILIQINISDIEVAQQKSVRTLKRHILNKVKQALEAQHNDSLN